MKYLSKIKKSFYAGKIVVVRLDLNVAPEELRSSVRVSRSLPTLRLLRDAGCRVVILSHRGRPDARQQRAKKAGAASSLKPLAAILARRLKTKIVFDASFNLRAVAARARALAPGGVMLLENVRLWPEEEKNDKAFAKKLAAIGDLYVNDAFAVSHRAQASVDAVTRYAPACAGLELEKEIRALDAAMRKPKRPVVLILGGVKISDKVGVLKNFWRRADAVLVGGGVANTFFAAQGKPIGDSVFEKNAEKIITPFMGSKKIHFPSDTVVGGRAIFDIGVRTAQEYARIIQKAGTIVWNGPMGYIEKKQYQAGTLAVARSCARSKAFCVVGGGETTSFFLSHVIGAKNIFLSTGGGAMLDYLAGEKLPGIEALKRANGRME